MERGNIAFIFKGIRGAAIIGIKSDSSLSTDKWNLDICKADHETSERPMYSGPSLPSGLHLDEVQGALENWEDPRLG